MVALVVAVADFWGGGWFSNRSNDFYRLVELPVLHAFHDLDSYRYAFVCIGVRIWRIVHPAALQLQGRFDFSGHGIAHLVWLVSSLSRVGVADLGELWVCASPSQGDVEVCDGAVLLYELLKPRPANFSNGLHGAD